jgi:asparagine synthase (glutamine-hydrolysing)
MSAIAGLYRTDGRPVNRHEVDRMAHALAHRGPDGTGAWSGGPVALAHSALWTTPESRREPQPLASAACNIIVADARLDNRPDLIAALDLAGSASGDVGDSELILRAYERWGEACAAKLIGDFAFAVWDSRNQSLFCARDHIGVKPLYYYQSPSAFLFASEIKALLTSPTVPYRLNPSRVADHLVGLFEDQTSTFYRGIYRLPAGHTLTVTRTGTKIRQYWSLDSTREIVLGSDEAYAEAFRECFTEAVRCRLRSSHPVGCLLSGGLDSSSIVATARHLRGSASHGKLDTFTAVFPGLLASDLRKIDERAYADAVVAQGGLEAHYVRGDLVSPLTDVDRALWHLDEGFAAPNFYLHWALYGAARDRGVRALLDGIDGDTTVSHGLERLPVLARTGRVLTLGRELRALSHRHGVGVSDLFWQYAIHPLIPASVRQSIRRLRRRGGAPLEHTVIKPEFAKRMGVVERMAAIERAQGQPARTAREAHARAMKSGLVPYALELADKAAAAFGVEPRYPFFDRRLMELCLALPADQKLRGGWSRLVMRCAMGGLLPEEVRWRSTKANLGPNFMRRLFDNDRNSLAEVVLEQSGVLGDYVDMSALRRAYDRCGTQPMSEADALTVFGAVVLGLWLQRAKIA